MLELAVVSFAAIAGLTYLNVRKDKQVTEAVKILASRNYTEYARGKGIEEKPLPSAEDRQRIAYEERLRDAEADPYSQG